METTNLLPEVSESCVCLQCNQTSLTEYVKDYEGNFICPDCLKRLYFLCDECEEYHLITDRYYTNDNNEICENCLSDNYFTCDECGAIFHNDNMIEFNNRRYCDSCIDEVSVICENCGARISTDGSYTAEGNSYCRNCFDELFTTCDNCCEIIRREDSVYYEDDCLCESCYDKKGADLVHDYNYNPFSFRYHSLQPVRRNDLFFGVELEVICKGNYTETCQQIIDKIGEKEDFAYLKHDGSLDSNGVEIVSHPFTLEYLQEKRPYNNLKDCNIKSFKNSSTGLHVHINRRYLTELDIARLVCFFSFDHLQYIINLVAQRDYNHYCQKLDRGKMPRHYRRDRYYAVNITNANTVEIRVFKGNCAPAAVHRAVQFCHAVIHFNRSMSVCQYTEERFRKYVYENRKLYPELNRYITANGYGKEITANLFTEAMLSEINN